MSKSIQGTSPSFRCFYTDPLAAAWMAKHFGMRLLYPNDNDVLKGELYYGLLKDAEGEPDVFSRLYVHSDSLRLLEPQVGDYGFDEHRTPCRYFHA
jgi:hypothetical protein